MQQRLTEVIQLFLVDLVLDNPTKITTHLETAMNWKSPLHISNLKPEQTKPQNDGLVVISRSYLNGKPLASYCNYKTVIAL